MNIDFDAAEASSVRAGCGPDLCLKLYELRGEWPRRVHPGRHQVRAGLIDGELTFCDELVTPTLAPVAAGESWRNHAPRFDKQPWRLAPAALGPRHRASAPRVVGTSQRYMASYER